MNLREGARGSVGIMSQYMKRARHAFRFNLTIPDPNLLRDQAQSQTQSQAQASAKESDAPKRSQLNALKQLVSTVLCLDRCRRSLLSSFIHTVLFFCDCLGAG